MGPEIQRLRGLHVVMAVIEQMRRVLARAGMMGDHHRLAFGLADAGVKPHGSQLGAGEFGGGVAVRRMLGLGRDGGDAQPVKPARHGLVVAGIGLGEGEFHSGHVVSFGWP